MPTGLTAALYEDDGDKVTFEEFAWLCTRGMGIFALMRDEPLGAEIPKRFEPSTMYAERVEAAKSRLSAARALTVERANALALDEYREAFRRWEDAQERNRALVARYMRMLGEVEAWEPPTASHQSFKDFMLTQLRESLRFDCYDREPPKGLSAQEYVEKEIDAAERDVVYCTERQAAEELRCEERNSWVEALRKSIGDPPAGKK